MNYFSKLPGYNILLIIGMLVLSAFPGCMHATHGRFSKDSHVSDAFRNGTVPTELNYFYAGRETMPYAIMGIDPGYTVPSHLWIALDLSPEKIRRMSSNISGNDRYSPSGFNIVAPDGTNIGIWFSSLHFPTVKVNQDVRTVEVRYKNPESYQSN